MLGIDDTFVSLAYVLCILSSILCIAWGAWHWNRGEEKAEPADVQWAAQEKKQAEADL